MLVAVLVVVVGAAAALAAVEVTRRRYETDVPPVARQSEPVEPEVPVDQVVHEAITAALAEMRRSPLLRSSSSATAQGSSHAGALRPKNIVVVVIVILLLLPLLPVLRPLLLLVLLPLPLRLLLPLLTTLGP